MSAAQRAWDGLNPRQRRYLEVLYDADQAAEAEQRELGAQGYYSSVPARTWRRIGFNDPHGLVVAALRAANVYDSGAGSTLAALSDRGLIETETIPGMLSDAVNVWLTRAGRAAVRASSGVPARPTKPQWALSRWLWRELVKVAKAGRDGLPEAELYGSAHLYLADSWAGRRGNRRYLHAETRHVRVTSRMHGTGPAWETSRPETRYHLTATAREHYAEHVAAYRQLYPDVEAPDLPPGPGL